MFSNEKKILGALCASVFALSAMAAATTVVSEPFATVGDVSSDSYKAVWSGFGSVTNQTVGYTAPTTGKPIAAATDKTYLSVDGFVQCAAATTANNPATVDMMIQIAKPDEALAMPSSETTTDIQIAIGVDTDGTLKVYSPGKGSTAGWQSLGTTVYTEGSWHRVSFTFNYGKGTCQISLDGVALVSANGYIAADTATQPETNGSWYKLNTAATQLATVKVVGSTAIDEVVVMHGAADEVQPKPAGSSESGVPNEWLLAQGVTDPTAKAPDASGMTVAEKYAAGYEVLDNKVFGMAGMTMSGTKATVTFPTASVKSGYTYVLSVSSDGNTWDDTKTLSSSEVSAGSVQIDLGTDTVKYYKLKVIK